MKHRKRLEETLQAHVHTWTTKYHLQRFKGFQFWRIAMIYANQGIYKANPIPWTITKWNGFKSCESHSKDTLSIEPFTRLSTEIQNKILFNGWRLPFFMAPCFIHFQIFAEEPHLENSKLQSFFGAFFQSILPDEQPKRNPLHQPPDQLHIHLVSTNDQSITAHSNLSPTDSLNSA